jgi:hypothetical protein
VLVHVAVAIIGLLAFCALSIDYGVMWLSRRQAQNAADAAALAGASSLAYDNPTDYNRARQMAKTVGEANKVFGQTLSITQGSGGGGLLTDDISFMSPTFTNQCPPGFATSGDTCIRVNVYRNAGNNPLPMFFGTVFGRTQQGVRATATAVVTGGNATNCMRPFGLPDKWDEWDSATNGGEYETQTGFPDPSGLSTNWDPDYWVPQPSNGQLSAYSTQFSGALYEADRYVPPSPTSAGTSYRLYAPNSRQFCCDYGMQMKMTIGYQGNTSGSFFQPLRVLCNGGNCYRNAIAGCDGQTRVIGGDVDTEMGSMNGPTQQGVNDLVALDPLAQWYPANTTFPGGLQCPSYAGCVYSPAAGAINSSPRIVPVPVMNIDTYMQNPSGMSSVTIMNLMGLFIEGTQGSGFNLVVVARIVPAPGFLASCPPGVTTCTVTGSAAFLSTVALIR